MRELYIILSVVGWAWCFAVAAFLWVVLRRRTDAQGSTVPQAGDGSGGSPEVRA